MNTSNRCVGYGLAKAFDFARVCERYLASEGATRYRDCVCLHEAGDVIIFSYGVVVLWGMTPAAEEAWVGSLRAYASEPFAHPYRDELTYSEGELSVRVQGDHILIAGNQFIDKLSLSHALAQSIKLLELEDRAESAITEMEPVSRNMAQTGSSHLGRRAIARMRGRLFLVQSEITLRYALLDTPEFFWEHPALEDHYRLLRQYLEVEPRVELLNRKLGVIHDMLEMLADEQNHRHSSLLEWIIIWLIAVDIVLIAVHDILGWI